MTTLTLEQIRSRPDFKYSTRLFYKTNTWRVALYQPPWRGFNEPQDKIELQDIWYRNRCISDYLKNNEECGFKIRADRNYFVYLKRPNIVKWLIENYNDQIVEINGPVNTKHQDILLNDLTVVTRPKLWYKKFRYKIMSTRYGEHEHEIFEEMQEFCLDSFEHGTYKLNDTFRITSKAHQMKMNQLFSRVPNKLNGQPLSSTYNQNWQRFHRHGPYTATGSIYLENHDDVVTLHMIFKKYITKTLKVVTLDEL
jgi:hypothetical protein